MRLAPSRLTARSRFLAAVLAAVVTVGIAAAPASAVVTGTVTDNNDGTATVTWSGGSGSNAFPTPNVILCAPGATPCNPSGNQGYMDGFQTSSGSIAIIAGMSIYDMATWTPAPLPAGTYRVELIAFTSNGVFSSVGSLQSVQIGSSGGSSSAASAPLTPATLSLGIDTASAAGGAVCKSGSSATAYSGQWLTLPGQSDCSLPSVPTATLLGWATTADFSVAIAQRQADNGWGTYQTTNDAGEITAVFIPAGHGVLVSGNNSLFPIWAK